MGKGRGAWRMGRTAWEHLSTWHANRERSEPADGDAALDALDDIATLRRLLDTSELEAVRIARRARRSWAEIATRLGVSRQSAWERWRDLDETALVPAARDHGVAQDVERVLADTADDIIGTSAAELASGSERRRRGTVSVPNVIGERWDRARDILMEAGLVAVGSDLDGPPLAERGWPNGAVTDQSPESGARVPRGSTVRLWLDQGGGGAGVREPLRPKPGPRPARELNYNYNPADADLAG